MQIPNISLAYVIAELKPVIDGSILRKVQELDNGWLKLRFQTRQGTKDIIAAPDAIFSTSFSMPAKQSTSGYGAFLRKRIANRKVVSFKQHFFDRIAVLEFEDLFLIFELFAKGNVILTDSKNNILSAFRKEQWKDRTLRKDALYKFPSSKGLNPSDLKASELQNAFATSQSDTIRSLIKEVNIAPAFAEAACMQAGIEKESPAKSLSAKQATNLISCVKNLYLIDLAKAKPLLASKEGKEMLLPFPLQLPGVRVLKNFDSLNQAVDEIYSKRFAAVESAPKKNALSRKQAELQKSMERQQQAVSSLQEKIEANSQKAELIYSNYSSLFELSQEVKSLVRQKTQEKEIMYKLKNRFPFLQKIDLKKKTLVVSLEK